jgi:hypothetical protein
MRQYHIISFIKAIKPREVVETIKVYYVEIISYKVV